jgi:hypothetical protein
MSKTLDNVVDDIEFERDHKSEISPRSQKDVFFIWILIVMISVIGANFAINFSDAGGITGFVIAGSGNEGNYILLFSSVFVALIVVLIIGLIHHGLTQKDK